MISIVSFVSKDHIMQNEIPESFAKFMIDYIADQDVLVGSKMFVQDLDSMPVNNNKTFVLSRSKKFSKAKSINKPECFKAGVVLGGKSTIASMMPYTDTIILGVSSSNKIYGIQFPSLKNWEPTDEITTDNYTIMVYKHHG